MLARVFYTATHFGFVIIRLFMGGNKVGTSCLYRMYVRTGHCKFRLDCCTKKKVKDGPISLTVNIPLNKVSEFLVSIPLEDLPLKVTI